MGSLDIGKEVLVVGVRCGALTCQPGYVRYQPCGDILRLVVCADQRV